MATIRVQAEPFDVARELAALSDGRHEVGGIGCFVGTVRSTPEREVTALTLEHYSGMTERSLAAIAERAEERFGLLGCTVIHRVGRLPAGEAIVLVLAAAPHRQDALDATGFLIDWLKTSAPFWKSESTPDGQTRWVEAREADDTAARRW